MFVALQSTSVAISDVLTFSIEKPLRSLRLTTHPISDNFPWSQAYLPPKQGYEIRLDETDSEKPINRKLLYKYKKTLLRDFFFVTGEVPLHQQVLLHQQVVENTVKLRSESDAPSCPCGNQAPSRLAQVEAFFWQSHDMCLMDVVMVCLMILPFLLQFPSRYSYDTWAITLPA